MPDNNRFPCEFCEKKFKIANDLRFHLKRANYRFNDCDFVGKQTISMEIHLEIYMCYDCDKRFKGLSDIMKHIQEEHEESSIYHINMETK